MDQFCNNRDTAANKLNDSPIKTKRTKREREEKGKKEKRDKKQQPMKQMSYEFLIQKSTDTNSI